jgi:hypothetical protein
VTSEAARPATLEATRCTTAWTCWLVRVTPLAVVTSTEALEVSLPVAKTSLLGTTTFTIALCTPSMASIVLSS